MQIAVIQDLVFGDCGKGSWVDYFTRQMHAKNVVRFNGGSQAGHTVQLPDGTRHVFSQFGSGTFAGASTYLSKYVLVNPNAMYFEAVKLKNIGIDEPLSLISVSPDCLITTPYHVFGNQSKEEARGEFKHGSCGMGIGETVEYSLKFPELCLRVNDLTIKSLAKEKMIAIRNYYKDMFEEEIKANPTGLFEDSTVDRIVEDFYNWTNDVNIVPDEDAIISMLEEGNLVFEGAQGVLLDQVYGFQPHTTWSNCTFENAFSLLKHTPENHEVSKVGVIRAYATRHGAGPFLTQSEGDFKNVPQDLTNMSNAWQGNFRRGYLDLKLLKYALSVVKQVDEVVISCMDHVEALLDYKICRDYTIKGRITDSLLKWAGPVYEKVAIANIPVYLSEETGTEIRICSYGSTYKDKKFLLGG